jgi:hypothetical protein
MPADLGRGLGDGEACPAVKMRGTADTYWLYRVAGWQPSTGLHVAVTVALYCTPLMVGRLTEVEVVLRVMRAVPLGTNRWEMNAPQGVCRFHWLLATADTGNTSTMYRTLVTGMGPLGKMRDSAVRAR